MFSKPNLWLETAALIEMCVVEQDYNLITINFCQNNSLVVTAVLLIRHPCTFLKRTIKGNVLQPNKGKGKIVNCQNQLKKKVYFRRVL